MPTRLGVASGSGTFYDGLTPTIYAAPTDQGTGDGSSEANAMDLPTAMVNATAGDVVGLLPGVYTAANNDTRWVPAFRFTNSGTSGNPIILVGKYDHLQYYADTNLRCEFRLSGTHPVATGPNCAVLGADVGQNYLQFRNFFIDQTYVPPRSSGGSLVISGTTTGVRFSRMVCSQTVNPTSDNYNTIFAQNATDIQVDHCYVYGGSGAGNHNASVITTYSCYNYTFEYNTLENVNCGYFIKGRTDSAHYGTIRYNRILDASNNGIELSDSSTVDPSYVYQNLLIRCQYGVNYDSSAGSNGTTHVYNNTCVDCTNAGIAVENQTISGQVCRDNLVAFMAGTSALSVELAGTLTVSVVFTTLDYNKYYESGGSTQFLQNGTTSTGIAAWQTAVGGTYEDNSTEGNPNFTNAAGDVYTLSVADTGSSTGGARGCYITGSETIGAGV